MTTKTQFRVGVHASRRATPADCATCPAEGIGLFSGAFRAQRAYLIEGFRILQLAPQDTLYRYGDTAECVFILRYGMIKLLRYSSGGEERIVRLARRGDTIGLDALSGTACRHTAVAVTPTALCRVPTRVVIDEEKADPRFIDRVMAEMQGELDQADLFLTELSTGNAHSRVARLMLYLAEREQGRDCFIPMREDIGALLGITMETASRIVSEFRHRGLIRGSKDAQRILFDVAEMQRVAAG
jgi:CRP-like cAMP-binding protein